MIRAKARASEVENASEALGHSRHLLTRHISTSRDILGCFILFYAVLIAFDTSRSVLLNFERTLRNGFCMALRGFAWLSCDVFFATAAIEGLKRPDALGNKDM